MAEYTLCWDCENSVKKGCKWAKKFKPIDGWTAEETNKGYLVRDCPEFIRDSWGKGQYRTVEEHNKAESKKAKNKKRE